MYVCVCVYVSLYVYTHTHVNIDTDVQVHTPPHWGDLGEKEGKRKEDTPEKEDNLSHRRLDVHGWLH